MTKIVSYNVNGIRAAMTKGLVEWIAEVNPDVICFQETKAQPEQIDTPALVALGYHCYWFSAQKKGYSGVGIATKIIPKEITYGMGIEKYDLEGRMIRADFEDFSVVSVYHPSGSSGEERQAFKMQWLEDFRLYMNNLRASVPNLIVSGDYNICRLWIDIHNPSKQEHLSGFLPEEREWFANFVADGWLDSFREFVTETDHYSWWSYRGGARDRNKGWRIDYNMATDSLKTRLRSAMIHPGAVHSDHCPVELVID
jgi:exodeoxyribonuclease-3